MKSYEEALTLLIDGQPVITPLSITGNEVRLRVNTIWSNPVSGFATLLFVPTATPLRFAWDQEVYGYQVQMPNASPHFCHPKLRHPGYEAIAELGERELLVEIDSPTIDVSGNPLYPFSRCRFWWEGWYERVNEAMQRTVIELSKSRRKMTEPVVRTYLQRAITQLIVGSAGEKESGLPITDERLLVRHRFEVRLGYPNVPKDSWLYEQIKLRYLAHVDRGCDILTTGKNKTGRDVIRVRRDAPKSHVTHHPVSEFGIACNALTFWAHPARERRENRSCQWLDLVNPTVPPLRHPTIVLPPALAKCVTTLTIAILDIPGKNMFVADEAVVREYGGTVALGETIALDGLLLCPSGKEKLRAKRTERSDLIPAEDFMAMKDELAELPGFEYERVPDPPIEILDDGTIVYVHSYRYWYERELDCRHDKVKALVGGLKAVCRPIDQLWAEIGDEEREIDLVVSAHTVASKGARDAVLYPLAANAGLTEIDPSWPLEELVHRIEAGLAKKVLPIDGRFPILGQVRVAHNEAGDPVDEEVAATLHAFRQPVHYQDQKVPLGSGVVGPVPMVRANETEYQQSYYRRGMSVSIHARCQVGIPFPFADEDKDQVTALGDFFWKHSDLCLVEG